MCPNHSNKLGNSRRTGQSLTTPRFFQPQRNGITLPGGHRDIILPWHEEQEKVAFWGEKKRGHQACHPKAGSSIALSQAPCPICQKTDVYRCKEMLWSHLPDLEEKHENILGGSKLSQATGSRADAPTKPCCHLQVTSCTSQGERENA